MGLLILGLVTYVVLRRRVPNAMFHAAMMVDSKTLVILLLIASFVTGITFHIPLADVVLFPLGLAFAIAVVGRHVQSADDLLRSFPFLASLASRAPPLS